MRSAEQGGPAKAGTSDANLNLQSCLMEQLEWTDVRCYEAQGVLRPRRRVASERGIYSTGFAKQRAE
jgi:hypothetical protein